MPGRLANKRCLIVGGTSGIGRAAALRFLEEGARLVVAGKSAEGYPGPAHVLTWDATDAGQVQRLFDEAIGILGGLDVLYHVAGISGRRLGDGPLHECTEAGWQATIDANLRTTFLTNRAAVRYYLEKRQPGVILNMASVLAWSPSQGYFDTTAYAASKGGILSLSRLAAARYAADGIRVNVLAPALINTPMAARACNDRDILAFLQTKQPLRGGPGQPDDCSGAAVFLCSDEASFITGAVLPIDGGWCVSEGQYRKEERGTVNDE
jgi:NAD(P)-dependent dehydrogenase (short-subunit alcohol dehydrogenase family)